MTKLSASTLCVIIHTLFLQECPHLGLPANSRRQVYGPNKVFALLQSKMMGQKAITSAETFVEDLQLQGRLTPEEFLQQRDAALLTLFPEAEFMPGTAPVFSLLIFQLSADVHANLQLSCC